MIHAPEHSLRQEEARNSAKDQLQLLFQELLTLGPGAGKELGPEATEALPPRPAAAPARPRKERTPRLPEHLPVIEEVIVPEPVKAAPQDWRKIGEEISERLDFEPARFLRRRTVRPKYVRKSDPDAAPIIADLPPCILERSIATPALVAKYCDHLPLYRQESIYRTRHGVKLPRQTMAQRVGVAADWLRLIYEAINGEETSGGYVQVDETAIRYLAPGHGKTKQGYFWVCHRPGGGVIFHWHTSRAAACLEKIIPVNFTGHWRGCSHRGLGVSSLVPTHLTFRATFVSVAPGGWLSAAHHVLTACAKLHRAPALEAVPRPWRPGVRPRDMRMHTIREVSMEQAHRLVTIENGHLHISDHHTCVCKVARRAHRHHPRQ